MPLYLLELTGNAQGHFVRPNGLFWVRTKGYIDMKVQRDIDCGRTYPKLPAYSLYEINLGLPHMAKGFAGAKIWTTASSLRRLRTRAIRESMMAEYIVTESKVTSIPTYYGTDLSDFQVRTIMEDGTVTVTPFSEF